MRRPLVLLAAVAVAVAIAACGLSVVGVDVGPELDAGFDAGTGMPSSDAGSPDAFVSDAEAIDANASDADTLADGARPDARPPDRGDCTLLLCNDAGGCLDESCGTTPGGHWPASHVDGGGSLGDQATDCTSTTAAIGQTAFKSATVPAAARYQYELRFQLTTNDTTKAVIAEIATGTTTALRVTVDQKQLRVCSAKGACTPPRPLPPADPIDIHVYGRMGTAEPFGSAILEIGRTDCTEVANLELDGPFPGDTVTAKVGCLGDAPCYLFWDDARITVRPF